MGKRLMASLLVLCLVLALLPGTASAAASEVVALADQASTAEEQIPEFLPEDAAELSDSNQVEYPVEEGKLYFDPDKREITKCDSSVTRAVIPSEIGGVAVTSIGDYAFAGCSGLTSVTIPNGVTSIGKWAFWNCKGLTNVTIPDRVTSIGSCAFCFCSSLTSVSIPTSVTSIETQAFHECTSLTDVYYSGSRTQWSSIAIGSYNTWLVCVNIHYALGPVPEPGSDFTIENGELVKYHGSGGDVTIPGGVTSIADYAFWHCSSLTGVTIGNSVTSIGEAVFAGCTNLTGVTIGNGVTNIGSGAFDSCSGLTSVAIPDSVTNIGSGVFWDCIGLTSVTIPASLTKIPDYAFAACAALTDVYYGGIQEQWEAVQISKTGNNQLTNASIHYADNVKFYTVTFDPNGGAGAMDAQTFTENAVQALNANVFTRPGYRFVGWDTQSEGGGTSYRDRQSVILNTNLTLYAQWTDLPLTIVASGICGANGDNLTWTLDNEGTLTISGTGSMAHYGTNAIPYAPWYANRAKIMSVIIEDGVTTIGQKAFYSCRNLTSVTIPNSVTSIEDNAFIVCTSLTGVVIPDSVTIIGMGAFDWCSDLKKVIIGNGVTQIGAYAFRDCNSLTSAVIGNSVVGIGEEVFKGCGSLISIAIPDSVTSIGKNAFSECCSLTSVTIGSGVIRIEDHAFYCCCRLTSVAIPNSVASIGDYVFDRCDCLTSVTIPNSVTSIGKGAFSDCNSLSSVIIPDRITSIGESVFYGCDSLSSVAIPDSVTDIGDYAFEHCGCLTSVTIPGSVTSIGVEAFAFCGLTSVNIPSSVTSIGEEAFLACASLTSMVFPGSVTCIESGVFRQCTNLANVTIEDGVACIGREAFYLCEGLTGVTIPDSVTTIEAGAFENCYSLTSVTIPDSITAIENYVFSGCIKLTSITIPDSVTSIGEEAFSSCFALSRVIIPNSVISIGRGAFSCCKSLVSIHIPDSVTSIGESDRFTSGSTFSGCESLASITLPDGIRGIGPSEFKNCDSLISITIPSSITYIDQEAFDFCYSLEDVYYVGTKAQWNKITISDYYNSCLFSAVIHYNSTGRRFLTTVGGNEISVPWDDRWFNNTPVYNHDLAVASAALSWAAYSESEATAALDALGFTNLKRGEFDYPVSFQGRAGYIIGEKEITYDGQSYTLIPVVVRGSKNVSDWVSNLFDSGWVDGDSGFEDAAKIILEDLNTYLHGLDPSENVKFLVTGHSRGGIVADLLAAELTQHGVLNGAVDHSYGAGNVFAYTFAPPRPSSYAKELLVGNIYNIISPPDPVPTLPPTKSARYGFDLILPCKKIFTPYYTEENGKRILHTYDEFWYPMQETYRKLTRKSYDNESYSIWQEDFYLEYVSTVHGIAAYYSWMVSHTAEELFGPTNERTFPTFKHIQVACPVDVYVYDEAGTLLVQIENDVVLLDELAATVTDGVKDIYLPAGQEYDVQIVATGSGQVDYSVEEVETSGVGDQTLRTVSFNSIGIEANDTLTGTVDGTILTLPAADYSLTKTSDGIISVIQPDSDSKNMGAYHISFEPNGGVLISAIASLDENGKLPELPITERAGYDFVGWFMEDGTQVDTNTVFNKDAVISARWTSRGPVYAQIVDYRNDLPVVQFFFQEDVAPFEQGTMIYAASYTEDRKLSSVTSGVLDQDGTVTFSQPVQSGYTLFCVGQNYAPIYQKLTLYS